MRVYTSLQKLIQCFIICKIFKNIILSPSLSLYVHCMSVCLSVCFCLSVSISLSKILRCNLISVEVSLSWPWCKVCVILAGLATTVAPKNIILGYFRKPDQFKTHHRCINERMISQSAVLYTGHIFFKYLELYKRQSA